MDRPRREASHGVVIGRFQVPALHIGHRFLLTHAKERHAALIIIVGVSPALDEKNPLSFEERREMLLEVHPDASIVPLSDHPSDEAWSALLDALVETHADDAMLYGSRDSFIPFYSGRFPTHFVEPVKSPSGTDIRHEVISLPHLHQSSRAETIRAALAHFLGLR